jgi:hypothetical protein
MGGSCRQDFAADILSAFLTELSVEIADSAGQAIGDALVDRAAD